MSLLTSLISYWKLDEGSGNRADANGSNTLTDNNTVTSATGKINSAADFERDNNEFLSHTDNADLSTGDIDFSFACWVNLESKPAAQNLYIAAKGDSDPTTEWALFYRGFGGTDRFRFTINQFTANVDDDPLGSPAIGTWHFIVCWHDSVADTISIQTNNGAVASTATGGLGPQDLGGSFRLGGFDGTATFAFDGLIDEVGFWKRVLTAQERTDLYNAGAGLAYPFAGTFTGTAACTIGAATMSASTTFTPAAAIVPRVISLFGTNTTAPALKGRNTTAPALFGVDSTRPDLVGSS